MPGVRVLEAGVMGAGAALGGDWGVEALGRLALEKEPVRGVELESPVVAVLVLLVEALLPPVHLGSVERHWE